MDRDRVAFTVPGIPVGKGRPRFARTKFGVRTFTPEKTAGWEALARHAAGQAMAGQPPFDGAVAVEITAHLPIPASWSKVRQVRARQGWLLPTVKPDADNLQKGALDAMNGVVYGDDKQAVEVRVVKRYSDRPRLEVSVVHLEAAERGVAIVPAERAA